MATPSSYASYNSTGSFPTDFGMDKEVEEWMAGPQVPVNITSCELVDGRPIAIDGETYVVSKIDSRMTTGMEYKTIYLERSR